MEDGALDVKSSARPRVAVIGGGWAGCAAAAMLASAGVAVTIFEQGPTLGGRARTVELDGVVVDNGQHLLLGACSAVLELLQRLHGGAKAKALLHRMPLAIHPFGTRPAAMALSAPRCPAPLHLALALLLARGLSWRDRAILVRDFRSLARRGFEVTAGSSVAACFAKSSARAFEALWDPLCLAALNTPSSAACGQTFARVLQAAFTGTRANSDFLVPAVDLGAMVPNAIPAYVARSGGAVLTSARVRTLKCDGEGVRVGDDDTHARFEAAVVAVSPHRLPQLEVQPVPPGFARALHAVAAFRYEPITTVYLAYDELPEASRMARLDDSPGQWIFDRGPVVRSAERLRLASVVISASGPHEHLDHATLAANVDAQLRRLEPRVGTLRWSRVVAERRATYACTPGLARPHAGAVGPRLYLAGDYTDTDFPATLEAAVRSGNTAASALLRDLQSR